MAGSYSLVIKTSAERELRALPKEDRRRVVDRIRGLAHTPRPPGNEKLSGQERYRIRQGDYRIVYAIDDEARIVEIVKIGHRREVYRKK
ncbi:MAG TPA: type II toxin-antitoxin system RelE/ParE family toxin [Nitrospirales bacterium]|nr:type II toxin-antitoxin system RelE/ParE family toxin [Nitrospirales bacterium]